jgi:hypothetical protein
MSENNEVQLPIGSVNEFLQWKTNNNIAPASVEKCNSEYTELCGGEKLADVLFSFLGIYAIGVWVYNKELEGIFRTDNNKIWVRTGSDNKYNQILSSANFLLMLQTEKIAGINVESLNETMNQFVKVYFKVGNVIPIWPGGNTLKGNQNMGFMDIPGLFFYQFRDWYEILLDRKKELLCFEKDVEKFFKQDRFSSLKIFLESVDTIEKYNSYIDECIKIINDRTQIICRDI